MDFRMTRAAVIAVLVVLGLGVACSTDPTPGDEPRPEWLAALIERLETEPVANPPALIARYAYRGQAVYYLPPRCCDIPSTVYDATGAVICHADGGLSGDGDGRCPDFFQVRADEKIVWRDLRGAG